MSWKSHGNSVKSHGNVMEKSWKFNFKFEWPPCVRDVIISGTATQNPIMYL